MNGGGIMRLNGIALRNFRGIDNMRLDFEGKSVVLYGINGAGKSTILKSINLILAQIITRVLSSQFKQSIECTREDVRFGRDKAGIYGAFAFEDGHIRSYGFSFAKSTGRRDYDNKSLNIFAREFSETYLPDEEMLPVFAHYGVTRAVLDIPLRIKKRHDFGRIETYRNALNAKTDFRTFFEWFRNQEDFENEKKVELSDLNYKDPMLEAVRSAILTMLPDLTNLRITRKPLLRMCVTKEEQTLSISQLSDGEKCALAMIGDLARRLVLANPHSDMPLCGGGIVLIDEVELHMHPSWQTQIVHVLHKIFPNIQFILTTHSPLVIGGLGNQSDKFAIYELEQIENRISAQEMTPAYYDANMVLQDKMGTPFISPEVDRVVNKISACIDQKNFDAAEENLRQLDMMTDGTHHVITRARTLVSIAKRRNQEATNEANH